MLLDALDATLRISVCGCGRNIKSNDITGTIPSERGLVTRMNNL
jgi:hypothetical protein